MKRLEELGIGRPSTWASIIQTIQDRGYVWKKGQALVPTWTAFAVVGLLEQHFDDLVDYAFTAQGRDRPRRHRRRRAGQGPWLSEFYFGEPDGEASTATIGAARPEAARRGEPRQDRRRRDQHVPARPRRRRQRDRRQARQVRPVREARRRHGERARRPGPRRAHRRRRAAAARAPKSDEPIGELDGLPGVRQERPLRALRAVGHRRRTCHRASTSRRWRACSRRCRSSASPSTTPRRCSRCRARSATTRPTASRSWPTTGATGPYVQKGKDYRSLDNEERLLTITLQEALDLLAQPKVFRRGGQNMAAKGPLREFGTDPVSAEAGRGQGRALRRVRHRRRDERVDRQGRPHRGDGARARLRAARGPPRAGRGQGRRAGQEALGGPQGAGEEVGAKKSAAKRSS